LKTTLVLTANASNNYIDVDTIVYLHKYVD